MGYDLTPSQMGLVRRTIAKDCNQPEFDLFMAAAKSYGLDPFRKQIIPLVFNKDKEDKRNMSIVVTRDGLRILAQRCADYRPASEPAAFVTDNTLVSDTNPKGIISASVRLWKQDRRGEWYAVAGEAMWDEFAPLREIWAPDETGKRRPTGRYELDRSGNWHKMPTLMLAKCAEAQALRAGWPDQFGGVYAAEEMDQAIAADMTASEVVAAEEQRIREDRVSAGKSILTTFSCGVLERVAIGEFCDRALDHLRSLEPEAVHAWSVQNREPLREFWAVAPNDALALRKEIETRTARIGSAS